MQPCIYCGNNPVNHRAQKFNETLDIILGPFRRAMGRGIIHRVSDRLADQMGLMAFHVMKPIGLIKTHSDINQVRYSRARVLWEEAYHRDIPIEEIMPFGRSIDLYRAKLKNKWVYFINLPQPEGAVNSDLIWIDDKWLLKQKLREHNLPVADGDCVTTVDQAVKSFRRLQKPLIAKPRSGSRGRHTTTFINTEEEMKEAFGIAQQLCHWVIIEEHLFGDVQRGTVVGGKLVGVLGGSSPKVTGDGVHTIAELIKLTDEKKPNGVKEIKVNPYYMQRQNLMMETILTTGETKYLSEKIGVNYGGTSYDCTPETHPDTKQMIVDAGKILDIAILGFDFIIPDITKSWKDQKCGIIECNGAPFIQLHHDPLIGKTINAAGMVWDLVS